MAPMTTAPENLRQTGFDQPIHFALPDRDARGRLVRLGPVLQEILGTHAYPSAVAHLLAEAITVCALMGSLLKDEGSQLTMQAQAKGGAVTLMVCDYRDGEVRGYADCDREKAAELSPGAPLSVLFGEGHLAVTFDLAVKPGRYQGIVPLEGSSIAEAVEGYFVQSEQLPSLIRTAIRLDGDAPVAAGMLLQHLPDGEEGRERLHVRLDHPEWQHASTMAASLQDEELLDPDLSLEDIVWRLYHEEREILTEQGPALSRGCRCSVIHFENVLARFGKEDRDEMRSDDGFIRVDCAFCSREFLVED
ncbi:Hsp33 family molecular chaperone HslO [Paraurantiacibacter namhicola]|uniref:33 kDa chaperonin n=1 Tax=Paraurantiacibacter namhicola TaxID=645517 RepID=A0A1C7D568_9SPHN|nr:Hsp33 family molecular chaperone HslO [Paraurantiacibacter namhicola]ANU06608.1 33 kDa chaperonin [Paraurantiacibacter namhicola]